MRTALPWAVLLLLCMGALEAAENGQPEQQLPEPQADAGGNGEQAPGPGTGPGTDPGPGTGPGPGPGLGPASNNNGAVNGGGSVSIPPPQAPRGTFGIAPSVGLSVQGLINPRLIASVKNAIYGAAAAAAAKKAAKAKALAGALATKAAAAAVGVAGAAAYKAGVATRAKIVKLQTLVNAARRPVLTYLHPLPPPAPPVSPHPEIAPAPALEGGAEVGVGYGSGVDYSLGGGYQDAALNFGSGYGTDTASTQAQLSFDYPLQGGFAANDFGAHFGSYVPSGGGIVDGGIW